MADPAAAIRTALADPGRFLGLVERNVEVKLIGPVLELLGWDPVRQILWGPQVQRHTEQGRQDVEADAFVADITEKRLRFVVEAKRWARPLDVKAIEQTLRYLDDVGAGRALLSNGGRWLVIDAGHHEPVVALRLSAGSSNAAVALLVEGLDPYLSPWSAPSTPLPSSGAVSSSSGDVEELADADPLIGELVSGIKALAAQRSHVVYLDSGPKGLLLRVHSTGRVIVPVNAADPLKPDLYSQELEALVADVDLRRSFESALRRLPRERTSEAVSLFLLALDAVLTDIR